jgi:hypothetical protein
MKLIKFKKKYKTHWSIKKHGPTNIEEETKTEL